MRVGIRPGWSASLMLGLLASVSHLAQAQEGSIAGRVTDAATGDPLENAQLT